MSTTLESPTRAGDTWRWWESRRLRYNIGLALAGWTAWGLFALEVMAFPSAAPRDEFHITLSLTLAQGLAWLVAMGIANILFLLGPVSEMVLRPADADGYRRRMFGLGFWFSMAVPFLFPALMLINLLSRAGL